MVKVFLCLGSNLYERDEYIRRAINLINHNHIKITRISPIYQTEPAESLTVFGIGLAFGCNQPDFLNCVVEAVTDYEPHQLMITITKIEKTLGRKRISGVRNLPRTIDIDILFYDDKIINEPTLKIPHPKIQERAFILIPLCDLVPDFVHPVLNRTIRELTNVIDKKGVKLWYRKQLVTSV